MSVEINSTTGTTTDNTPSPSVSGEVALAFWVKVASSFVGSTSHDFLHIDSTNNVQIGAGEDIEISNENITGGSAVNDDTWHHFMWVTSGGSSAAYLDGEVYGGSGTSDGLTRLQLGELSTSWTAGVDYLEVAHIAYYDYSPSADEIRNLIWNRPIDAVHWWPMDDSENPTDYKNLRTPSSPFTRGSGSLDRKEEPPITPLFAM